MLIEAYRLEIAVSTHSVQHLDYEATCFNFSLKLAAGQAELARCTPLYERPAGEGLREQLEDLLATKWPVL